jgi:signal transduction histidine kinase
MMNQRAKFILVASITLVTLTIHYYDLFLMGYLGHSSLMHAIHGRLCYIPIVLGAVWFGIRGGIITALTISVFSLIYIFIKPVNLPSELFGEYTEIAFYLAIGGLSGLLLESERSSRRKKEEAEKKLLQAERLSLMGQMVASIAHEIKNPLGSIKGAVQILGDKSTPPEDRSEFTSIIEKEVDRLDGVVRDYLSYARPVLSTRNYLDLNEIIKTILKQVKFQSDERHINVVFEPSDLPLVTGDADKLRQLLLNMILNAIQAMPSGGKVEVLSKALDSAAPQIEIVIADNGPGIKPEDLTKIFDPFFSTKAHGTGLGLATARAIVSEHNGDIKVESTVGKGTTFTITLPVNKGMNH